MWGDGVKFTYNKLWKMLIDRNMNKKDLRLASGVSTAVIAKLGKGDNLTTDVLLKICTALDCDAADIMEIEKKQFVGVSQVQPMQKATRYQMELRIPEARPAVKTTYINNRRYLGNKYKLLPFITSVVASECKDIKTIADIFAGTGAVASAFTDKMIITNDILYSNYICHVAWFSPQEYSAEKVTNLITQYNGINVYEDN